MRETSFQDFFCRFRSEKQELFRCFRGLNRELFRCFRGLNRELFRFSCVGDVQSDLRQHTFSARRKMKKSLWIMRFFYEKIW